MVGDIIELFLFSQLPLRSRNLNLAYIQGLVGYRNLTALVYVLLFCDQRSQFVML